MTLSVGEFVARMYSRVGGNWAFAIAQNNIQVELAADITSELETYGFTVVRESAQQFLRSASVDSVHRLPLDSLGNTVHVVLSDPRYWHRLDLARSQLPTSDRVIFVGPEVDLGVMNAKAPNLASWLGGRVWNMVDGETSADVGARLEQLSTHFGISNAQVIAKAEAGELGHDPEFAEWLVLLQRGDLLGR